MKNFDLIKQLNRHLVLEASDRRQTVYCGIEGCEQFTKLGKPYCSEHVFEHTYPAQIRDTVEAMLQEIADAVRGKNIRADGFIAEEILSYLEFHGPSTCAGLGRDINIEKDAVQVVCHELERKKMVRIRVTKRGAFMVSLRA